MQRARHQDRPGVAIGLVIEQGTQQHDGLRLRGIDAELVDDFARAGFVFEQAWVQYHSERPVGVAFAEQCAGDHAPRDRRVGLLCQDAQQRIGCFAATTLLVERRAQMHQRTRPVWIDRQRGAGRVLRIGRSSEHHQNAGAGLMQRGVLWNKHDRAIERLERRAVLTELLKEDGKQAARRSVRGLLRNNLAQRRRGLANATRLRQAQRSVNRRAWRLR
ncbi:MAG TPA: hypothetical protein VLC97_19415 [Rhodanobacteraceae bacterium]|nr:hypothetical protein [Rhodanobacteraceae bacterium]